MLIIGRTYNNYLTRYLCTPSLLNELHTNSSSLQASLTVLNVDGYVPSKRKVKYPKDLTDTSSIILSAYTPATCAHMMLKDGD